MYFLNGKINVFYFLTLCLSLSLSKITIAHMHQVVKMVGIRKDRKIHETGLERSMVMDRCGILPFVAKVKGYWGIHVASSFSA